MQKITPFLWFNDNAEEAINFYLSIFKDGKILTLHRNEDGTLFIGRFQLQGQEFMALNGGPTFKFTEAISLMVDCDTGEEVDELWEKLSEGGEKGRCGWLKDKYGLSWQIVPTALGELMSDPDPIKTQRVMDAVLQMTKLDAEALQKAYRQE